MLKKVNALKKDIDEATVKFEEFKVELAEKTT